MCGFCYNIIVRTKVFYKRMKKIVLIFAGFALVLPAMAEGEMQLQPTTNIVTTSYVRGAYNTLENAKQAKLNDTNVITDSNTAAKPLVASVTANNGTVTITKSEVTIPVGNPQLTPSQTRAAIWVE